MGPKGRGGKAKPPPLTKEEKQTKRKEEQLAVLERNQAVLQELRAWMSEKLIYMLSLDKEVADERAAILLTQTDDEIQQWELKMFDGPVGFVAELLEERQRLRLGTVVKPPAAAKKKEDPYAKKEKKEDRMRDAIYKLADPDQDGGGADNMSETASTRGHKVIDKRKFKKIGGIAEIQGMEGVLIPGVRMQCNCEARKHALVQNCVNCGKIICEQEGKGPCTFCGIPLDKPLKASDLVQRNNEEDMTTEAAAALQHLRKALESRDRLLGYEATKAKRTTVIDDQVDYFESTTNVWLDADERAAVREREKEEEQKREKARPGGAYTVELDLVNATATLKGDNTGPKYGPADLAAIEEEKRKRDGVEDDDDVFDNVHLTPATASRCVASIVPRGEARVKPNPRLPNPIEFVSTLPPADESSSSAPAKKPQRGAAPRVANDYYEEDNEVYQETRAAPVHRVYVNSAEARARPQAVDNGQCLSMHQPWASLLVHGIKQHEGRSWSTTHRGRLWIHAAAHTPSEHDIAAVENFYRGRGTFRFPTHYPQSVLLGSVDVDDCLSQEEYRVQLPGDDQESQSEHVFICSNAQLLVVPLRMDGKHKIFQMEKRIWNAAKTQAGMAPH